MMLHQAASRSSWRSGRAARDLVVTVDDSTSRSAQAIPAEAEGNASNLAGSIETIAARGLFCSLFTDRGSDHVHAPEARGTMAAGAVAPVGP